MLDGKVKETYHFLTARELRDFLNGWTDRQLDVLHVENSESDTLAVEYRENDMEDGSHTYDLRFR